MNELIQYYTNIVVKRARRRLANYVTVRGYLEVWSVDGVRQHSQGKKVSYYPHYLTFDAATIEHVPPE